MKIRIIQSTDLTSAPPMSPADASAIHWLVELTQDKIAETEMPDGVSFALEVINDA